MYNIKKNDYNYIELNKYKLFDVNLIIYFFSTLIMLFKSYSLFYNYVLLSQYERFLRRIPNVSTFKTKYYIVSKKKKIICW